MRLAIDRATDEQLEEIEQFAIASAKEDPTRTVDDLVLLDEKFHEYLVGLTGNTQMLEALRNINSRIQFVRWMDMTERRPETQQQHRAILAALKGRSVQAAEQCIHEHIAQRLDQIVEKVERSYGRIFVRKHRAAAAPIPEAVATR
ncbi:MAG: FCD domain-containing protein [Acidobacteriaceae bacterium]